MIPQPLNDLVIIEPEKTPDKIGNIHIPDSAKKQSNRGTVVAAGPGKRIDPSNLPPHTPYYKDEPLRLPMTLKEGDRVLFPMYAGQEIEIEGEGTKKKKLLVMREDDVLAVIGEEE